MPLDRDNSRYFGIFSQNLSEKVNEPSDTYINLAGVDDRKIIPRRFNSKVKLPKLIKASSDITFKHEIWATSVKYNEVKEDLSLLKQVLFDEKCNSQSLTQIKQQPICNPFIAKSLENIKLFEEKIEASHSEYKEIKEDRLREQKEICKKIQSLDSCPFEKKSSQCFLKLCNYKTKDSTKNTQLIPITKPKYKVKRRKKIKSIKQKAMEKKIRNNIQLAKELSMKSVSLTDDEKERIELLMADMKDDDEEESSKEKDESPKFSRVYLNAFSMNNNDRSRIISIQDKLSKILKSYETIEDIDSKISCNINYTFNWKEIKELSLKDIDKALNAIHDAETENTDNSISNNDTSL